MTMRISRASALTRGNPVKKQYDLNGDVGGPIVKQKAWFFVSWRLNDQYKYILGLGDELERSKLSNPYTLQGHVPGRPQQPDHRLPEQAREAAGQARHLAHDAAVGGVLSELAQLSVEGANGPACSAAARSSTCSPATGTTSSRCGRCATSACMTARGRRPARTPRRWCGRTTGGNNGYQDQKRYKPQFYTTLSYFKDGWKGSHDFRFGFDWKRDRRSLFNDQPFDIWYRDNNGALAQVDLYNSPRHRHQRRRLHLGVGQRHVEAHQPADAERRRPLRELPGRVARAVADAERPSRRSPAGPIARLSARSSRRRPCRRRPWPTPTRSRRRSASPMT